MSSDSPLGTEKSYRALRRRALIFALLGIFMCFVLAAAFEPSQRAHRAATLDLLARAQTGGFRFDRGHAPLLVLVGGFAGVLAGMLGMGGGVLKVAGMLVVFQIDILLARAVSLTTMFLAATSAAIVHLKNGTVWWEVVRPMLGPALIGVFVGMLIGNVLPRATLTHIFGFFVLFLGFNILGQAFADPNEMTFGLQKPATIKPQRGLACAGIGGLHGLVCGLLGISGGVIAMPMQQALIRVPARSAVANSVVVSAVSTSFGSLATITSGVLRGDFQLGDVGLASLCIGGGATIGAQLGARLTGSVRVLFLKLLFLQVIFAAGITILFH